MPSPVTRQTSNSQPPLRLFNTLTRSLEDFHPLNPPHVGLYSCGPTVYHYAHLGNLRATIFADTLKRVLSYNGYDVTHVMNITDVGHLASDADEGEDKLEKGAARQGKTVWEVARFYEDAFVHDYEALGNQLPTYMPRATEHVIEQIELIKKLADKGYTYQNEQAIYYDVSKFPTYTNLSNQPLEEKQTAARTDVNEDPAKKHPADFALWFFTTGRFADHAMRWPSPWGEGFPGWHIECSAMSMKYLGEEFDLHTGGIEHIGTHHTNEIAQSEAATGHQFVHYWLHNQHLTVEGGKMAKSSGDFLRLQTIVDKGFAPSDFRYLMLTARYRTELEFNWEAMQSAATTLKNLKREVGGWDDIEASSVKRQASSKETLPSTLNRQLTTFNARFLAAINDDLDTATALTIVWDLVNADLPTSQKRAILNKFDDVLGLSLKNYQYAPLTDQEQQLIKDRDQARATKDWPQADRLRDQLLQSGIELEDTPTGTKAIKL